MNDTTMGFDQIEEEILSLRSLRRSAGDAAGTGKEKAGNYTLGFCSGLSVCPG